MNTSDIRREFALKEEEDVWVGMTYKLSIDEEEVAIKSLLISFSTAIECMVRQDLQQSCR